MAFEMTFTDDFGEVYPESYFKLVQCNICLADKTGNIVFYGYPSAAQKGKRIIGQKSYAVTADLFNQYFVTDELDPEGENPYKASYIMALAIKDIGEGEDAVSFFENAEAV